MLILREKHDSINIYWLLLCGRTFRIAAKQFLEGVFTILLNCSRNWYINPCTLPLICTSQDPETFCAIIKELAAGILASSVLIMMTKMELDIRWSLITSASTAAYCFKLTQDKMDNRYYTHMLSIIATTIQILGRSRSSSNFKLQRRKYI